jgi:hypothetical protein
VDRGFYFWQLLRRRWRRTPSTPPNKPKSPMADYANRHVLSQKKPKSSETSFFSLLRAAKLKSALFECLSMRGFPPEGRKPNKNPQRDYLAGARTIRTIERALPHQLDGNKLKSSPFRSAVPTTAQSAKGAQNKPIVAASMHVNMPETETGP